MIAMKYNEGGYKNRKLTELHHTVFGLAPNGIRIIPMRSRIYYKKGFYKAKIYKVTQRGGLRPRNGKFSTMFPDNWSRRKVKQVIRKAYLQYLSGAGNPVDLSRIMGKSYKGISIRFHFDNKTITSVYPEF